MHLEVIHYFTTAAGASGTAAAGLTGTGIADSLVVKNAKSTVRGIAHWGHNQADGWHQLITPSAHDTTRGWRTILDANNVDQRLPLGCSIPFQPQETIAATIAGSAVAGDVEIGAILMLYKDLPGVNARLLKWSELIRQAEMPLTIQASLAASGTGYTGAETIIADSDLLRANRDYALLGIESQTDNCSIVIDGPDTGYARIACPGNSDEPELCGAFFSVLSRLLGDEDTIPIINSGNKASTYVRVAGNENTTTTVVSLNLMLLK